MRNVSDKRYRENENTRFIFDNFHVENRAVYEIFWKNTVDSGRPRVKIGRMRIACWIPKATNTLILILAVMELNGELLCLLGTFILYLLCPCL